MGTRGSYGMIYNGELKDFYNNNDSYPEGLFKELCENIKSVTNEELIEMFKYAEVVYEDGTPNEEQRKVLIENDIILENDTTSTFHDVLKKFNCSLKCLIDRECPYIEGGSGFLEDGLYCEYCYYIDLDKNVVHIFSADERCGGYDTTYKGYISFKEIQDGKVSDLVKKVKKMCKTESDKVCLKMSKAEEYMGI